FARLVVGGRAHDHPRVPLERDPAPRASALAGAVVALPASGSDLRSRRSPDGPRCPPYSAHPCLGLSPLLDLVEVPAVVPRMLLAPPGRHPVDALESPSSRAWFLPGPSRTGRRTAAWRVSRCSRGSAHLRPRRAPPAKPPPSSARKNAPRWAPRRSR